MVVIREKRVAYKHPDLCVLKAKREHKFFLHPQIQLVWIEKAAELGLQVLVVGVLLQFRKLLLEKDSVTLPKEFLSKFGISRGTKQRALKNLEKAGLISVARETGRNPTITILAIKQSQ